MLRMRLEGGGGGGGSVVHRLYMIVCKACRHLGEHQSDEHASTDTDTHTANMHHPSRSTSENARLDDHTLADARQKKSMWHITRTPENTNLRSHHENQRTRAYMHSMCLKYKQNH